MRCCYVKHGARQSCRRNHLISVSYILLRVSVLLYTDRPTNRQVLNRATALLCPRSHLYFSLSFSFFYFLPALFSLPFRPFSPLPCHIVHRSNYKLHDNSSLLVIFPNKRNRFQCNCNLVADDFSVTFEWRFP